MLRRGRHRSGKLERLDDMLDAARADGEQALLFTQFAEFGHLLAPHLAERRRTECRSCTAASAPRRATAWSAVPGRRRAPVMLLSLKAGGTGLNLTAANHVVHFDRWWNPAVEDQATDRAFRIGQHRTVQVRKLVCVRHRRGADRRDDRAQAGPRRARRRQR